MHLCKQITQKQRTQISKQITHPHTYRSLIKNHITHRILSQKPQKIVLHQSHWVRWCRTSEHGQPSPDAGQMDSLARKETTHCMLQTES